MATFTDDMKQVEEEFLQLAQFFKILKNKYFPGIVYFREISMGMSGDYHLAISSGSTMVRVGTLIFGNRHYNR